MSLMVLYIGNPTDVVIVETCNMSSITYSAKMPLPESLFEELEFRSRSF